MSNNPFNFKITITPTSYKGQVLFEVWKPSDLFMASMSLTINKDVADWIHNTMEENKNLKLALKQTK